MALTQFRGSFVPCIRISLRRFRHLAFTNSRTRLALQAGIYFSSLQKRCIPNEFPSERKKMLMTATTKLTVLLLALLVCLIVVCSPAYPACPSHESETEAKNGETLCQFQCENNRLFQRKLRKNPLHLHDIETTRHSTEYQPCPKSIQHFYPPPLRAPPMSSESVVFMHTQTLGRSGILHFCCGSVLVEICTAVKPDDIDPNFGDEI